MRSIFDVVLTFALSTAGGLLGLWAGIPAGLLAGGALAVTLATLAGLRTSVPLRLRDALFVLVGLSMGANVSPDTLHLMTQWPVTLIALMLELFVIIVVIGYVLLKLFRLDRGTAYLSSFPGHLSLIMALSTTAVGDPRQIVVIQIIRVMILTMLGPIGAAFLPAVESQAQTRAIMDAPTLALVLAGCVFTGWAFSRLKVPAAYVLGAMAFATLAKLLGLYTGVLHPWLVNGVLIAIGALIGSRFAGVSRDELKQATLGGLVATGLTVVIVTGFAIGAAQLVDMPLGQIWIGLSPGALEAMGALGVALGYDTAFIAAHHVSRLLVLSMAIPLMAYLVRTKR